MMIVFIIVMVFAVSTGIVVCIFAWGGGEVHPGDDPDHCAQCRSEWRRRLLRPPGDRRS